MAKSSPSFPDHNQNFWQLASIQGASQGLIILLTGGMLAKKYGAGLALSSICLGNLLLWIIGLGIISMSLTNRQSIIQTVQEYLGKAGGLLIILILTSAFVLWYAIELQVTVDALNPFFSMQWNSAIFGLFLGILIACLSMGGIKLIKRICVASFPVLLCFLLYGVFCYGNFDFNVNWAFSFSAVVIVLIVALPGVVNFGVFFRHSHSRSDSILGLTITIISYVFFEACGALIQISAPVDIFNNYVSSTETIAHVFPIVALLLILVICANIVNIYLASAGLELLMPKALISKGYFLIGLLGSIFYFFLRNSSWISVLEAILDNIIVNLGIVLLISFFMKNLVRHRPRKWERGINNICWLFGCLSMIIFQRIYSENPNKIFLLGIWSTLLIFMIIIFFEQLIYSSRFIRLQLDLRNEKNR